MVSLCSSREIVNVLIHAERADLKKLSQADRKICMLAIESFLTGTDCSKSLDETRIQAIESELHKDAEGKPFFLIRMITSLFKGVMNKWFGRITSDALFAKLAPAKQKFLEKHFDDYLNKYCTVEGSALEGAQVYFLSEIHDDPIHELVEKNIIEHFARTEGNLVLLEGLEVYFPDQLGKKKFKVENWDNKENYEAQRLAVNEQLAAGVAVKEDRTNESKQRFLNACTKFRECKKARDFDLQLKVARNLASHHKIFVIAGATHHKDGRYSVLNTFMVPCAHIAIKQSAAGALAAKKSLAAYQAGFQY